MAVLYHRERALRHAASCFRRARYNSVSGAGCARC
jgi:hypothetical protein